MLIDDLRGRAINLRNFAAHKKPVLCSRIGRKSGQIFATGSEDAIVKVWHAANDEPLMSLIGHKSPITCLTFNNTEDLLIAAAESGSIRSWDLNSGQQLNHSSAIYVNGHRASVTCIDYHPFANYFATGSLDTNLKVWDVKERKAVQTYKGQVEKEAVTVVKFTPDGKWIVTGCEDGYLRVYDVIAGKLFFQTQAHRNALTCMDFHPSDFLVATGSLDRTVSVFNIDGGIDMVSRSDIFPSAIKSVQFSPNEGSVILSICNEGMKVHGWKGESMRCIDNVDARWSDVGDVYLHQGLNQVMTVANNPNINGYVGVWVIPVDSVKPWYTGSGDDNKKVILSPQITQESFNENLNSSTEDVLNEIRNRKPVSISTTTTNNGEVFTVTKVSGEGKRTPQLGGQTPEVAIVSAKRKEPANLDIDNFLPKGEAIITDMDDEDIINGIMKSHQKMAVAMTNRLNNLKIVRRTWLDQGDPKEAIKAMAKMKDLPLASDMLNELLRPESKKNLSLDMCVYLLPIIIELVQENYEEHISTALKITHLLHNCFAQLIEDNLQLANSNAQIDINLEARISKCQSCKKYFGEVKRIIIGRSADFAQLTDLALLSRRVVKSIK